MKTLNKESLMDIIEYEKVRHDYRKEVIDYKVNRRVTLGPNITMVFENEKTLSFQIQEIMRAERLVHDEQIQEEIEVYNSIMPPEGGLSATLFIEITDEKKIKSILNDFIGLTDGDNLYFQIGNDKRRVVDYNNTKKVAFPGGGMKWNDFEQESEEFSVTLNEDWSA